MPPADSSLGHTLAPPDARGDGAPRPSSTGALAGGAALLALGVNEALRLARGDTAAVRRSARRIGASRVLAGIALLARPTLLPAQLGWTASGVAPWLARLLAVRECTLGAALVAATRNGGDPLPWLLTVSTVDAAEAAVIVAAWRRGAVTRSRAGAFLASDLGSAAAGAAALAQLRRRVRT